MSDSSASVIAANRFGLGARPGELASIGGDARGWLAAQLGGGPLTIDGSGLVRSAEVVAASIDLRRKRRQTRTAAESAGPAANDVMKLGEYYRPIFPVGPLRDTVR